MISYINECTTPRLRSSTFLLTDIISPSFNTNLSSQKAKNVFSVVLTSFKATLTKTKELQSERILGFSTKNCHLFPLECLGSHAIRIFTFLTHFHSCTRRCFVHKIICEIMFVSFFMLVTLKYHILATLPLLTPKFTGCLAYYIRTIYVKFC